VIASVHRPRHDSGLAWQQLTLVVLLLWVAVGLLVGTVVGHGIALGTEHD